MRPFRVAILGVLLAAGGVRAWQYEDEFTLNQMGGRPGGGGNWGTGGRSDRKVTCVMCHVLPDAGFPSRITATVAFNPTLAVASDGGSAYLPNTTYAVTVAMVGEHLIPAMGGNHNQMGATFEDSAGQNVGRLHSDTGFSKGGTCPTTLTNAHFMAYDAGSTTVTYAGCNAIVGRGRGANGSGHTQWRFWWTSPADAGTITLFYGVTDASGEEKSTGDDSVMGTRVLEPGP